MSLVATYYSETDNELNKNIKHGICDEAMSMKL